MSDDPIMEAAPRALPAAKKRSHRKRAVSVRKAPVRVTPERAAVDAAMAGVASTVDPRGAPRGASEPEDRRTRVSREQRSVGAWDLPRHRQKPGWDYEWKVNRVLNEPVGGSVIAAIQRQGWRPEPAGMWPELVAPGTAPDSLVEVDGQILYSRPMRLTMEAKQEDVDAAQQQLRDRVDGALAGRPLGGEGLADMRGVRMHSLQYEVVGEAGEPERVLRRG